MHPLSSETCLPGVASPRAVTRGESFADLDAGSLDGLTVSVDWLNFVFKESEGWEVRLREFFSAAFGLHTWVKSDKGVHGYRYSARVGAVVIGWGGDAQRQTVLVSCPGSVVGASSPCRLRFIASFLTSIQARITRCDIACDDLDGRILSVDGAIEWWKDGGFTAGGRTPSVQLIDDMGSGKGRTFYVGRAANGKVCRIYEKGRQLGDASSAWVRVEVQLGSRDREIPHGLLADPAAYLAGSYRVLAFISACPLSVRTIKLKELLDLAHITKYARLQSGAVVHALLRLADGDYCAVVDQLIRHGVLPSRLDPMTFLRREVDESDSQRMPAA